MRFSPAIGYALGTILVVSGILVVGFALFRPGGSSGSAATATATVSAARATPTQSAPVTAPPPVAEPTQTPAPPPPAVKKYKVNDPEGVSLRKDPGTAGQRLQLLPADFELEGTGEPPRNVDGEDWIQVKTPAGEVGWVVLKFLAEIPAS